MSPRPQSALEEVEPGDVVIIEEGHYYEDLNTTVSVEIWYCYYYTIIFLYWVLMI